LLVTVKKPIALTQGLVCFFQQLLLDPVKNRRSCLNWRSWHILAPTWILWICLELAQSQVGLADKMEVCCGAITHCLTRTYISSKRFDNKYKQIKGFTNLLVIW